MDGQQKSVLLIPTKYYYSRVTSVPNCGIKMSAKKAASLLQIVRFSTKRAGEIGKLSPEWTKCLVPLVNSSKVKIQGKIVFQTMELRLMQDILLYVRLISLLMSSRERDRGICRVMPMEMMNQLLLLDLKPVAQLGKLSRSKPLMSRPFQKLP